MDIAAVRTAIEYEYRFTEYRFTEYRFAEYEYEYDEIRCEARTPVVTDVAEDHDSKNQESTGGDFAAPRWYARQGHLVIGVPSTLDQSPVRERNLLQISIPNDTFKRTSTT